jgi:hypothetical protein
MPTYYTPISEIPNEIADAATFNSRFDDLDAELVSLNADAASLAARVVVLEEIVAWTTGISLDFTALIDGPIPFMTGATFAVASGKATNTPALGSELLTDPGLEDNYTTGLCDTLTLNGSAAVAEETSDIHGGSSAQKFTAAAFNNRLNWPVVAGTAGAWYQYGVWTKRAAGTSGSSFTALYQAGALPADTLPTYNLSAAYTNKLISYISTGTGNMFLYPVWDQGSAGFDTILADDGSLKRLTYSTLWALANGAKRTDTVKAQPTLPVDGTLSGVVLWADATASPATCLLAWWNLRGQGDRIQFGLLKCVAGTWSTVIAPTSEYVATGAWLEVRPVSDNSVALYYNNVQYGTTQTVADVPGSVVGFMISGNNTLEGFYVGETTPQAVLYAGSSFTASVISFSLLVTQYVQAEYPAWLITAGNQAEGGAQTWFNLVRLDSYLTTTNPIVTLDTANDDTNTVTKASAGLEAFIRRLYAHSPGVQLIGISSPSWSGQDTSNNAIAGTPTNLAAITAAKAIFEHYGISYAGYLDEVVRLVNAGTYDLDELVDDTVHPTAAGYAVMAGLVEAFLPASIAPLPIPLPARLYAESADFEHTPSRINGTAYASRTGVWSDNGASTSSSAANATITYSFFGRSYGIYRADDTYPDVSVSIDGGAYATVAVGKNGHDIGTRAAHTVTIKVLTTAKIEEFWVI